MQQILRIIGMLAIMSASTLFCGCSKVYSIDVNATQKISATVGNFAGNLHDSDQFGQSLAKLGDINLDGVTDLAVGAPLDDDNGTDQGAVHILFMSTNGRVNLNQKISGLAGNFAGVLHPGDHFGAVLASIGDLNLDGHADIAVGAPGDDEGGIDRGALWVLNLDRQGLVLNQQKIAELSGNLNATFNDNEQFGSAVTTMGDLDGDGVIDLAVGAPGDNDGGTGRGAIWILLMNRDGTVKSTQKISDTGGLFSGGLHDGDRFGFALADMGDLDGNGVHDLAVGAPHDADGGPARGAVWILLMNHDGTVSSTQKISQTQGQFDGVIGDGDQFGTSVTNLGDLNNDGVPELGVGVPFNASGGPKRGAIWVVFLRQDRTVISSSTVSSTQANFSGPLHDNDEFGSAILGIGDLNKDGTPDIVAGASLDDDGGTDRGAVWVLFMNPVVTGQKVDPNTDLTTLYNGRGY